jgi:DNA-binding GntR family transcriptional regulator
MPATLTRIDTTPDLAEQVHRRLLDAISQGELQPGARLTQEELAERLGVSRQPVLQALRLLKKDGFVLDAPGRGVQVAPLDANWLINVYQVRAALDGLAARLACEHGFRLEAALIEAGRHAVASGSVGAMIEADAAFHAAIYRAANNPLIEQTAQLHWQHIRRAMGAVLQTQDLRDAIWDEHQAIADAIGSTEAARAELLMRRHGEDAGANMGRRIHELLKQHA